jgi:predicted nucleic acid-binding protein
MTTYFADSYFWFALANPWDGSHARAIQYAQASAPLVTTAWVITELADGLCKTTCRTAFLRLHDLMTHDPFLTIVPADQSLMGRGLALYASRPDKDWSLTDCISFVVMPEHKLTEALTGDHHFEQAGFVALLK